MTQVMQAQLPSPLVRMEHYLDLGRAVYGLSLAGPNRAPTFTGTRYPRGCVVLRIRSLDPVLECLPLLGRNNHQTQGLKCSLQSPRSCFVRERIRVQQPGRGRECHPYGGTGLSLVPCSSNVGLAVRGPTMSYMAGMRKGAVKRACPKHGGWSGLA